MVHRFLHAGKVSWRLTVASLVSHTVLQRLRFVSELQKDCRTPRERNQLEPHSWVMQNHNLFWGILARKMKKL